MISKVRTGDVFHPGLLNGLKVSSLNIAQIKAKCGIIERENYNTAKNENVKQPNCTEEKENAIKNAFKYFQMI